MEPLNNDLNRIKISKLIFQRILILFETKNNFVKGDSNKNSDFPLSDFPLDDEDNIAFYDKVEDSQFQESCFEACRLCRKLIQIFKCLHLVCQFFISIIIAMVAVTTEYKIEFYTSLTLSLFGGFIIFLHSLADWSKLIEKYSEIYTQFFTLSFSKSLHRVDRFRKIVLKYESNSLFIDFFNNSESLLKSKQKQ